jgi:putative tributyrin esterase
MARLQIHTGIPDVSLDVIVPEYMRSTPAKKMTSDEYYSKKGLPVLWLLHGGFGIASDWLRYTQIELFAEEKGLIVACPSGENGCYVNWVKGEQWSDIVTEKLWGLVHNMLPTSDDPKDNFIAGLSMGGYGALNLGLSHPDRYSRIGSFSGGVEVPQEYVAGTFKIPGTEDMFGDPQTVIGSKYDLYHLAQIRADSGELPPIYMSCGTLDKLYPVNVKFRDALREMGYNVTWDESEHNHEWRFWNIQVEKFINTLPL